MGNEQTKKRVAAQPRRKVQPLNSKLDVFTLRSFNSVKKHTDIPASTFLITKLHIRVSGTKGSGKSTLVHRFLQRGNSAVKCGDERVNLNFQSINTKVQGVDLNVRFIFTDFTGNNLCDILKAGFHFVVFDLTDRASFLCAQNTLSALYSSPLSHYGFTKYIVLVGNKADMEREAQVSTNEAAALAKRYNVEFRTVSAMEDSDDVICKLFYDQIELYTEHRLKDVEGKQKKQFEYLCDQRSKAKQFGVVSQLGSTYFLDS